MSVSDLDTTARKLFLRESVHRSAFWVLLVLSSVISAAGVVGDSVATVIGAMIVAPLMTPILGTALAAVLALRRQVVVNLLVVVGGAVAVVAIAYLLGLVVPEPVVADTNSQVAARVSPKLIDLLAALATGVVGAFALMRADLSDALPGVAIAISLVPPLSVVGLTLESGAVDEALGAALLFATNVAAIIATGVAVLLGFHVRELAGEAGWRLGRFGARTIAMVTGVVLLVSVPLGVGTYHVFQQVRTVSRAQTPLDHWAEQRSWRIADLRFDNGVLQVTATGPPPAPDTTSLRQALRDAGLDDLTVRLTLIHSDLHEVSTR
ncbi:DUF389 domain-containing protein [Actinophytocola xinjiangensis]|uniref:DUF389 domain-containing protein n=1 Tax=Actinophytocola xinjiangensis TaxID=485602 RepID=A0A7Z0WQK3_9PSEU|nr:DUF389 domain-containing protein [Actinophytocola xinjiangensis]